MMIKQTSTDRLIAKLRETTAYDDVIISPATEIVYDLGIAGWDLWNLVEWVQLEFEVDFTGLDCQEFSPGEGGFMTTHTLFGKRKDKSLKVSDLQAAIEHRSWTQAQQR